MIKKEDQLISRVKKLLKEQNAVIVAHYYVAAAIQKLAEDTGGFVGDSLAMAKFAVKHSAKTLVVVGVRFMGETAKILNPDKKVLVPSLESDCSLDFSCPAAEFAKFCHEHQDRTVVVYVNTSAAVKALADWVVTSSIALDVVKMLKEKGEKILWAPDRYLGGYIQRVTGADMLLWHGSCVVHERFKAKGIAKLKQIYPDAAVLVHPESPAEVVALADVVGSTSQLLNASKSMPNNIFIVATEAGIVYQMRKASPHKEFIVAPTAGEGATCKSCAVCPWMALNTLELIEKCLIDSSNEIFVPEDIAQKARKALDRMMEFVV